jgi:hypothetical protein
MDTKHRYRLLIYFAALILCLSVCFANAESVSGSAPAAQRQTIIFESSHGRTSFLMPLQQSFLAAPAASVSDEHVVPQSVLQQVTDANHSHHFWHGSAKHRTSLVLTHQANASSSATNDVRNMGIAPQSE